MEPTFGTMLSQMTGVFALLLIGYLLNHYRMLPSETEAVLSRMSARLFLPALMLYTLMGECTIENLRKYGNWVFFGVLFQVSSVLLAIVIARRLTESRNYLEGVYRYVLGFPNTGGVGTPIVQRFFGSTGMFQYQLFLLPNLILCYSWAVVQLMPGEHKGSWRKRLENFCNPVFLAVALGAFLGLTGLGAHVPEAVSSTLGNLGSCYATISMLLTGFVIGDYTVKDIVGDRKVYLISALRLLIIPIAFLAILELVQAPERLCVLTCLAYACPCGMNSVVYPAAYGQDTRPGASLVLVTSTLAVFTIPLLFVIM